MSKLIRVQVRRALASDVRMIKCRPVAQDLAPHQGFQIIRAFSAPLSPQPFRSSQCLNELVSRLFSFCLQACASFALKSADPPQSKLIGRLPALVVLVSDDGASTKKAQHG